jgi:hypothetical protein
MMITIATATAAATIATIVATATGPMLRPAPATASDGAVCRVQGLQFTGTHSSH